MRVALVLLSSGLLLAQSERPGDKCRLEGSVLNSTTGEGVRRAKVTLTAGTSPQALAARRLNPGRELVFSVRTDSDGRFAFAGIDAGEYRIGVERAGFQASDATKSEPLTLAPGEEKKGVAVRLTPLAVVSGRIRDQDGDGIRDVQLSLIGNRYTAGGPATMQQGGASTNDLGEYRIYDIPAGKYFLRATPRRGNSDGLGGNESFASVYYPAAQDASGAGQIELRPGQHLTGVDLLLPRIRGVTVRGRVLRPLGLSRIYVTLGEDVAGRRVSAPGVSADEAGAFEFQGVAPGTYTLQTRSMPNEPSYAANLQVHIGLSDVDGIELKPLPSVDVRGTARIEGKGRYGPPMVGITMVGQNQAYAGLQEGGIGEDGAFVIKDVQADTYRAIVRAPGDLYVKSLKCGETELADSVLDLSKGGEPCPLSIVLSANGGELRGTVVAGAGVRLSAAARVTLIPADSRRTPSVFFRSALVSAKGDFLIAGIAPGTYRAVAWDDVDLNAARYDPEFQKGYEGFGQTVQMSDGVKKSVTLDLTKRLAE
jgi:hypothetical protein